MTTYAVHTTDTGVLVSVGTIVADPLPAGLTTITLSPADTDGLGDGSRSWDPATRAVIPTPGWVDPAIPAANKATIEEKLDAALVSLRAMKVETNATINQNPAQRIKDLVDVLLPVVRHVRGNFDGTA